jgi:hypothetical protein
MLVFAIASLFAPPEPEPIDPDVANIQATVEAGVDARLTEIVSQAGTPNPAQIQTTVEAGIDATLTQIAVTSTPVPQPAELPDNIPGSGIWNWFVGIIVGMWRFVGRAGIWAQCLCCIVPVAAIVLGIVND